MPYSQLEGTEKYKKFGSHGNIDVLMIEELEEIALDVHCTNREADTILKDAGKVLQESIFNAYNVY